MQRLFRRSILAVTDPAGSRRRVVKGRRLTKRLVRRFVAGERLDDALVAARDITSQGMTTTLDLLGENVATAGAARRAGRRVRRNAGADGRCQSRAEYLGQVDDAGPRPRRRAGDGEHGRDPDGGAARPRLCPASTWKARPTSSRRWQSLKHSTTAFPTRSAPSSKSYLYRSEADVERLIARGMRVRLVKGAYAEPPSIAHRQRANIDAAFVRPHGAVARRRPLPGNRHP